MLGRVGKNPGGSFGARVYTPQNLPPPPHARFVPKGNPTLSKSSDSRSCIELLLLTKKKVDITKTSSNDCLEYIFVISGGEGRGGGSKGRDNR